MKCTANSGRSNGTLFAVLGLTLGLCAQVTAAPPPAPAPAPGAAKPWIFFDLGENSLVATPKDPQTGDIASVSWMRFQGDDGKPTDAHTYLVNLRAHGYPIGLIVNIPQEWGDPALDQANAWLAETDPAKKDQLALDLTAAKVEVILDYFDGRGPGDAPDQKPRWNDPDYAAMDFTLFTRGAILVPFFNRYRKPMDGPTHSPDQLFLYREAIAVAARNGTKAIYQGADANDIAGARKAGMILHPLPYNPDLAVQAKGYYLSEPQIDQLASGAVAPEASRARERAAPHTAAHPAHAAH